MFPQVNSIEDSLAAQTTVSPTAAKFLHICSDFPCVASSLTTQQENNSWHVADLHAGVSHDAFAHVTQVENK